ncbi:ABC transporter permease [Methanoculleus sp. FWC-SCC1]|uniref:ABC transporter permease n=1 Tax=Methanoculleus frigidifontis TaxID=2584085 RepID=A0ABT8M8F5_9EURY|nr:ABC transporter permease [Methanoculleus sp. FWC-SCC1]MDN7024219.1 ABC transporter permease [Methanoculleus sp. FWC-SCC1]
MNIRLHSRIRRELLTALSVAAAIVLWQVVAEFIVDNRIILPSFTDVVAAFLSPAVMNSLLIDLGTSLLHFGVGLGAALLIGIPLGVGMGWFRTLDSLADPIIEVLRPIPPLAWIPFAIIWFGLTTQAAGFVIFVGAFFPILTGAYTGLRGVPKTFVEAGKVLGCDTNLELIRHIALPAALPAIASGIRVAMGVGWMCLVAAEIFGVSRYGIGHKLWVSYSLQNMPNVVVYMLILGFLGLVIDRLFRAYTDSRLLRWRTGEVV